MLTRPQPQRQRAAALIALVLFTLPVSVLGQQDREPPERPTPTFADFVYATDSDRQKVAEGVDVRPAAAADRDPGERPWLPLGLDPAGPARVRGAGHLCALE